jgi:uncharacterized protein (DUF488 family)
MKRRNMQMLTYVCTESLFKPCCCMEKFNQYQKSLAKSGYFFFAPCQLHKILKNSYRRVLMCATQAAKKCKAQLIFFQPLAVCTRY